MIPRSRSIICEWRCLLALAGALIAPGLAGAQEAEVETAWTLTASAGLSLTGGNTKTSTFNAAYSVERDDQLRNVFRSEGLMIRGRTSGELATDRVSLDVRDEFRLHGRAFVFGQGKYLRDRFKDIDYLVASTAGVGYHLLDTPATSLSVDGSVGGVWEKNPEAGVQASGAVTMNQKLRRSLTDTTTVTESFSALWKTDDFSDALITLGVGLAASVSARTQLKIELLDTYKNTPPRASIRKNDVALLLAVVFKT